MHESAGAEPAGEARVSRRLDVVIRRKVGFQILDILDYVFAAARGFAKDKCLATHFKDR